MRDKIFIMCYSIFTYANIKNILDKYSMNPNYTSVITTIEELDYIASKYFPDIDTYNKVYNAIKNNKIVDFSIRTRN